MCAGASTISEFIGSKAAKAGRLAPVEEVEGDLLAANGQAHQPPIQGGRAYAGPFRQASIPQRRLLILEALLARARPLRSDRKSHGVFYQDFARPHAATRPAHRRRASASA
jgi:hypothetical protein